TRVGQEIEVPAPLSFIPLIKHDHGLLDSVCNLASPPAIAPTTLVSVVCRATRRAFLIALAFERPCETIAEPLIPKSGTPPYSAQSKRLNTLRNPGCRTAAASLFRSELV